MKLARPGKNLVISSIAEIISWRGNSFSISKSRRRRQLVRARAWRGLTSWYVMANGARGRAARSPLTLERLSPQPASRQSSPAVTIGLISPKFINPAPLRIIAAARKLGAVYRESLSAHRRSRRSKIYDEAELIMPHIRGSHRALASPRARSHLRGNMWRGIAVKQTASYAPTAVACWRPCSAGLSRAW